MMNNDLYQALQRCIEMLRSGASVEQCLARYSQHKEQLRPLLLAAASPSRQPSSGIPSAARARVRQRVMERWDREHSPRGFWSWMRPAPLRWAATAAAVVLFVLGGGTGVVTAAQISLPGETLYPVKQLREDAGLWFATSPGEKIAIYSGYTRERAWELLKLTQRGDSAAISISLSRLEQHLKAVDRLAETADTVTSRPSRLSILETLESVPAFSTSTQNSQETFSQIPEGAYPCLQHTTEVLRRARERVNAAVEKVGGSLSESGDSLASGTGRFCPP